MKSNVVEFKNESVEEAKFTSSLAMTVALVSWGMLFATLFLGYAIYRFSSNVWPPMGFENVSLLYPSISTVFILFSSVTFHRCYKAYEHENLTKFRNNLYGAIFWGLCFVISQAYLWHYMKLTGLYVESGIFASILHGFTWIHAGHMVLGLLCLFYLVPVSYKTIHARQLIKVKNVGMFWHFLDIIWILMFVFLFAI